jgi:hypothetical protein
VPTQDWAARKDRHDVDVDALVFRADGTKAPVKLINLSGEGCRMEAMAEFRVGERLSIAIPRMGQVKAQVRWCEPGRAGAKFLVESDF